MNREEFCKLVAKARKESGKSLSDIYYGMKMQYRDLIPLEKGTSNFNIDRVIPYVNFLSYSIYATDYVSFVNFDSYSNFVEWEIAKRKSLGISKAEMCRRIGANANYTMLLENQKTKCGVDMFIKIIEVLGYTVGIMKLEKENKAVQS